MDSIARNLRVLWRAESIIADIKLRRLIMRSSLWGIAALLGLFAFLMGNLAVFFALQQAWGPVWAAAAVAGGNFALALILVLVAHRNPSEREMELATEVRDLALQELQADAAALQEHVLEIREEVRGIRQGIGNFVRHPLDTVLPSLLVPLAGAILKGLRKAGEDKG